MIQNGFFLLIFEKQSTNTKKEMQSLLSTFYLKSNPYIVWNSTKSARINGKSGLHGSQWDFKIDNLYG